MTYPAPSVAASARTARPVRAGFTLIEVLVALAILALIALLSWRGVESLAQTKERTEQLTNQIQILQTGLAQWSSDLDNAVGASVGTDIDWDGRVLRLTRRMVQQDGAGLRVVGWTRRDVNGSAQWLRWQSEPLQTRAALTEAWSRAGRWAENPGEQDKKYEVAIAPLDQWQIFYYRNDAWSNPLSSVGTVAPTSPGGAANAASNQILGVRLVLTLPASYAISGTLSRDWIRPTGGGGKS